MYSGSRFLHRQFHNSTEDSLYEQENPNLLKGQKP